MVIDEVTLGRALQTTWRTDAGDLDVLTEISDGAGSRVGYADLRGRAVLLRLDDYELRVIGLDDLISSKEAAGRTKDHDALLELRRLRDDLS